MQKAVTSGAVTFAMLLAMEPIKGVLDLELGNAGLLVNAALYVAYGALVGLIVSMVLEKKVVMKLVYTYALAFLALYFIGGWIDGVVGRLFEGSSTGMLETVLSAGAKAAVVVLLAKFIGKLMGKM